MLAKMDVTAGKKLITTMATFVMINGSFSFVFVVSKNPAVANKGTGATPEKIPLILWFTPAMILGRLSFIFSFFITRSTTFTLAIYSLREAVLI